MVFELIKNLSSKRYKFSAIFIGGGGNSESSDTRDLKDVEVTCAWLKAEIFHTLSLESEEDRKYLDIKWEEIRR